MVRILGIAEVMRSKEDAFQKVIRCIVLYQVLVHDQQIFEGYYLIKYKSVHSIRFNQTAKLIMQGPNQNNPNNHSRHVSFSDKNQVSSRVISKSRQSYNHSNNPSFDKTLGDDGNWHSLQSINIDSAYDLSKSMMNKFPGRKQFMGNHLEIVCLFQAVEIQRLTAALQQYHVRLKEAEKMPLDRQSYEIQIKEMTDVINTYKIQLDSKNAEMANFQRDTNGFVKGLEIKYEKAIKIIDTMHKDNSLLQQKLSYFELQNRKLQVSRQQMSSSLRQFHNLSLQRSQMQIQIRKVQDSLVIVSKQKESYQSKLHQLNSRISQLEGVEQRNEEYENKLVMISQEIQRLNIMVKQRNKEKLELTQKNTEYETKIRKLETEIVQIRHQLQNERIKQKNYEQNIEDKSHRIESLMQRNREYERMTIGLKQQVNRKNIQFQSLQNTNRQLLKSITQTSNELKNSLQSSRNNQDNLKAQLQRIQKQRAMQIHQLEQKIRIIVQQRQQHRHLHQNQINSLHVNLKNNQSRIRQMQVDKQRIIQQKDHIIQRLQKEWQERSKMLTQVQEKDRNLQLQRERVLQQVRQKDITIKRLTEQHQLMAKTIQQAHGKCNYLESELQVNARQLVSLQQQKLSLNNRIKGLIDQIQVLKRQLIHESSRTRSFQNELQNLCNQNRIGKASQEQLKSEIKNLEISIQKLRIQNANLWQNQDRLKNNQEKMIGQINRRNQQINSLRNRVAILQKQLNQTNMQIQRIKEFKRQNESIKNMIRQRNQSIKKQQIQINQLNQRERQGYQQKRDIQAKLKLVTNQLQRIQNTVNNKNQQHLQISRDVQYLRNQNSQLINQNESLRQKYEGIVKINQSLHVEVKRTQKYYQSFININAELKSKSAENSYLKDQIQLNLKKIELLQAELIQVIKLLQNLSEDQCQRFKISGNQLKMIRQEIAKLKDEIKSEYFTGVENLKSHSQELIGNVIETTRNNRILQQKYNRKIRQLQQCIANNQRQISHLQNNKITAETKIQQLRVSINEKSRQNEYHKEKEKQLKHQIQKQKESIIILQTKIKHIEEKNKVTDEHNKAIDSHIAKNETQKQIYQLQTQNQSLRRNMQKSESQRIQLITKIRKIQTQISQKEQIMQEIQQSLNQQNRRTETSFEQIFKQKERLNAKNMELMKQNKALSGTIEQLDVKLQQDLSKIEQLTTKISHLGLQLQKKVEQLDHQSNIINKTQENRINDKRTYQSMISSMKSQAKTEIQSKDIYMKRIQQTENKIGQMKRQIKEKNVIIKRYQASLDANQQKIEMLIQHCQKIQVMNNSLQKQWKDAISEMQKAKRIAATLNDSLSEVFRQLEMVHQKLQENNSLMQKLQIEQEKNYKYQQLILVQQQTIRNLEIEKQFLQKQSIKGRYVYENYEKKIQALIKQFDKYEKVIEKVRRQNVELKNSNYDITLELKKTQLFKKKIDMLNQEIDRLSKNNDSLCEQVSTCHLSIGEQSSLQRRIKQHLTLFPLLFCQIQSLRNRVQDKQQQLKRIHRQSLPRS